MPLIWHAIRLEGSLGAPTMRSKTLILLTIAIVLLCTEPTLALAQSTPHGAESDAAAALSEQEREQELAKLLRIVRAQQAPIKDAALTLDLEANPEIGEPSAPLVIVEFSDFQCGYCRRHITETMPRVMQELVDTGKVRYVFFDYPIASSPGVARQAAEAARCADEQGRYWPMRRRLFEHFSALQPALLATHAAAVDLDPDAFQACLDQAHQAEAVARNRNKGLAVGVRGTPTFLLGFAFEDGGGERVKVMKRIDGAQPFGVFEKVVENLLAQTP